MQDDVLLKTTTPYEALLFAINMRLSVKLKKAERRELVNRMIKDLGLESCRGTMVGDALKKGISGGERKRTAIGIELITSPDLIFLDEPTSGLDSYASWNVVSMLKRIATRDNATILAAIHQPSSEVFQIFDNVIVMSMGEIVYGGPVKSLAEHFKRRGFPCPNNSNPSDHALFILKTVSDERLRKNGM